MREPAVAGMFYEESPEKLFEQVRKCYLEAFDGEMPQAPSERRGNVLGAVSPHAGFYFSGTTAARSYGNIAMDGIPGTFIIIGPLHGAGRTVAMGGETYSTPLGEVEIDNDLVNAFWKPPIDKLSSTHRYEHSIEVQLPFIQFLDKPFKLVPIAMGRHDYKTAKKVGETIVEGIRKEGREDDVVIVASSDFSHVGPSYRRTPTAEATSTSLLAWMEKYDGMAVDKITEMDGAGLLKVRDRYDMSACGAAPIAAMLTATKMLGATRGEKLEYTTSYEKSGRATGIVGYASIIIRK